MNSIVVADAGPLHYLILINCADQLENMFAQVLIPPAVRDELLQPTTPQSVKDWITKTRPWLKIETVLEPEPISGLQRGETEALALAVQTNTSGILMDDLDGRAAARRLGLTVIGTIGILERAAEMELIDLPQAVSQLKRTNFYISEKLLEAALERNRQRHNK